MRKSKKKKIGADFEEIETQIFMRAEHNSLSQKPFLDKAEPKGQA